MIPMLATAAANVSNIAFTRMDEAISGAMLTDAEGKEHGKSKVAGFMAVAQSACTRAVIVPCACLLLPPAAEAVAARFKVLPTGNVGLTIFRLGFIYMSLQGALPAALAVFPQTIALRASDVEEQFQGLTDSAGKAVDTFYCNKGL
jgi:hypothetical protein